MGSSPGQGRHLRYTARLVIQKSSGVSGLVQSPRFFTDMTPKADRMLLSADDIDRLIALSNTLILANPEQASSAREVTVRVRNDQAMKGAPAELLHRLDSYISGLPKPLDIDGWLDPQPKLNFVRQ